MKDLLETLLNLQLNEAPVLPGEKKGISFRLRKLDKVSDKLNQYKNSLSHMKMTNLPPDLQKEMDQLQNKLNLEINKVQDAYERAYQQSMTENNRPVKMDNLFKALAKNCKEIIKVYKELNRNNFERDKFLFRGIKASDDALYGRPFDARKPKDSNRDLHELVNGAINNLGYTANRENAMFVTGDRSQASGYGNSLYIMFPVDGFTFTWSQTVKDLVLDSGKRLDMMDKNVINKIRQIVKQAKSENPEGFPISDPDDLFYTGYNYENDREKLLNAVEAGKLPDEVEDLLDDILTNKSIQEHFQFTDQGLFDAILSEKEIYIRGNYYAINYDHRNQLFKFLEQLNTDEVELPENFGEVPNLLDRGDVVRILSGTHQGKLGTLTYVYSDKYEVYITQKVGDITISKDEVELYHLPDGSIPIYEKNDKVIVTDNQSRLYGTVAILGFSNPNGKVEITDMNSNYHTLYKSQIEHYTPELEQEIQKDLANKPPVINEKDDVVVSDPDSEYYGERGRVNFIYSSGTIEVYLQKKETYIEFQPNQLVLLKNAPPELLKKVPGEYNLGDMVKIVDGEYKGYSGKVTYLYTNGTKAEVNLGTTQVDVPVSALEHEDQDSSDSGPGIKVGDTIKVTNNKSGYYGTVGQVIEVGQTEVGKPWIKFKSPMYTGGVKTFIDWVQKVEEPQQTQQTFKKNDKFKVKEKSFSVDGAIATVLDGPDSDGDYKAVTDDGKIIYTAPFQMEKIEVPSLKMGDYVKILDKSSGWYGGIGKIENGPDGDGDYTVVFDDDDTEWSYFQPDAMEKVEEPKATTKFAVDDIVKITGPSAYNNTSYIGYGGTITSVSDDGKFAGVQFDPDTILTYDTSNLVKGETDEISNLTWEPEPEVKAPTQTQFSEGDRVEVVSGFPSLMGMKGKITQVSPNYDFVSVWLDGNSAASSFPVTALKKITEPEQTEEIHLGDMVEVINDQLSTYGQKGKVTDLDAGMVVIQDSSGEVFFAKKASVKKIG